MIRSFQKMGSQYPVRRGRGDDKSFGKNVREIKIRSKLKEPRGTLNLAYLPKLLDLVKQDIYSSVEAD